MLNGSILFLVIAIIAAVLGFTNIAGVATTFAKVMFILFLILWFVSLLRSRKRTNA